MSKKINEASRFLFRGWDKASKRFIHNLAIPAPEGVEVNQCIGLTDTHGIPIFENDIVKWGHLGEIGREEPPRKAVVKLNPDIVFETYTPTEFGCPHQFHYSEFAYKETSRYLEIIGNMYENREVLDAGMDLIEHVRLNSFEGKYDKRTLGVGEIVEAATGKVKYITLPKDRMFTWDYNLKSQFIESLIMDIPMMPLMMHKSNGVGLVRHIVIDGAERIKAICEFVTDGFNLRCMEGVPLLNLKVYSQLPVATQQYFLKRLIDYWFLYGISDAQAKALRTRMNRVPSQNGISPHPDSSEKMVKGG